MKSKKHTLSALKILNIIGILIVNIFIIQKINKYNNEKVLGENIEVSATLPYYIKVITDPEKRIPPTNNDSLEINFELRERTTTNVLHTEVVTSDNQGKAELTPVSSNSIPHDNYDISIKGLSHLRKNFTNKEVGPENTIILDLTHDPLLAGDSHPTADNYINGMDISYEVINLYTNDLRGDLNRDTTINSLDLSILINNLYKVGDD